MDNSLEKMLRDALDAEPPAAADARIRAAIRFEAASRRRTRRMRALAAAAALVLLLGGGMWQFDRYLDAVSQSEALVQHGTPRGSDTLVASSADDQSSDDNASEEGEIVLEIIDMADPVEFEAFQVAQL